MPCGWPRGNKSPDKGRMLRYHSRSVSAKERETTVTAADYECELRQSSLAVDITSHHLRNCADDVRLFSRSRSISEVLWWRVHSCIHTVAARSRLRSADHGDFVVPRVRSTRVGCRSFRVCGWTIWNKLPQDLRSTDTREQFKRSLERCLHVRTCIAYRYCVHVCDTCMQYRYARVNTVLRAGYLSTRRH